MALGEFVIPKAPSKNSVVPEKTNKKTGKNAKSFLSFPSSLKENETLFKNCLHFSCVNFRTTGGGQSQAQTYRNLALANSAQVKPTSENLLDIYLYKPLMTTKLTHMYEGVSSSIIAEMYKGWVGALDSLSSATENPSKVTETRDTGDKILGALAGLGTSLQSKFASLINESTASALQQTSGQVYTTPSASMYKGTNVRTQAFNFKFNPRNKNDLEEMAQIIYNFHYFSLPTWSKPNERALKYIQSLDESIYKTAGATYYDTPKLWFINEMFGSTEGKNAKRWTPRFIFGPAAITNIEYNMTPDEFSKTLKNTAADPASVDMSITFTELIPMDSQMYNAQNANTEVHNIGPDIAGRS